MPYPMTTYTTFNLVAQIILTASGMSSLIFIANSRQHYNIDDDLRKWHIPAPRELQANDVIISKPLESKAGQKLNASEDVRSCEGAFLDLLNTRLNTPVQLPHYG
ncbi:hypothetical protein X801_10841, partial [Opisthorchis viverrini]